VVFALPIRNETLPLAPALAVLLLPADLTNIDPLQFGPGVEKESMKRLLIGEGFAARSAGVCS
jgi:hypothetical protein